ncbi:hypothetical protein, partial [Dissulfurirhabdus thermomarina]|uniref:hypothetical protein n=1 Tax=Dissulfurirhabdus thermomarina TaxID=1765737 RepID=UPI001C6558A3
GGRVLTIKNVDIFQNQELNWDPVPVWWAMHPKMRKISETIENGRSCVSCPPLIQENVTGGTELLG